jgi:hypothetical protein
MSIRGDVEQLETIRREMKILADKRKVLKQREAQIIERISSYLKSKNQPGVKYQGKAVIMEEKETFKRRKPKESDADAVTVLERYGVKSPQKVLNELLSTRKGEKVVKTKLKYKNINTT